MVCDFLPQVSVSMKDLCFDVYGTEKEKKDPKEIKGNRGRCLLLSLA